MHYAQLQDLHDYIIDACIKAAQNCIPLCFFVFFYFSKNFTLIFVFTQWFLDFWHFKKFFQIWYLPLVRCAILICIWFLSMSKDVMSATIERSLLYMIFIAVG